MYELLTRLWPEEGKSNTARRVLAVTAAVLLTAQLGFLLWFNCTRLESRVDYDSTTNLLRAVEMHRQGRLMPEAWVDTTNAQLDTAVPLTALLLGIIPNVFRAQGIAVSLLLLVMVALAGLALRELRASAAAALTALNVLLCPATLEITAVNDLGYASCMLLGSGYYMGIYILFFGCAALWLRLGRAEHMDGLTWALTGFLALLTAVSGASRGIYAALVVLLPALLYSVLTELAASGWRGLLSRRTAILTLLTLLLFAARRIAAAAGIYLQDETISFVPLQMFFDNLFAVLAGLLGLIGALPTDMHQPVLALRSGFWLFGMLTAAAVLLGLIRSGREALHGKAEAARENGFALAAFTALFNLGVLAVANARYAAEVYELRYTLSLLIPGVLCLAALIDRSRENAVTELLCFLLLLGTAVRTVQSDGAYLQPSEGQAVFDEVGDAVRDDAAPVVYYLCGEHENATWMRCMRVLDGGHVYRDIWNQGIVVPERFRPQQGGGRQTEYRVWGDTTRYTRAAEYEGPITLCAEPEYFAYMPQELRELFTLREELACGISVYTAQSNVLGLDG